MNNEDQVLMGSIQFGPNTSREDLMKTLTAGMLKHGTADTCAIIAQNAPEAPCEPSGIKDDRFWPKEWEERFLDKFDVPMSFRDFLRLKKEVLDAYKEYLGTMGQHRLLAYYDLPQVPEPEWPEALKGLTREDIEVLKQ